MELNGLIDGRDCFICFCLIALPIVNSSYSASMPSWLVGNTGFVYGNGPDQPFRTLRVAFDSAFGMLDFKSRDVRSNLTSRC